jgi:hypothetical protein
MTKFSMLFDTLLPNWAWNRRVRAANSSTRLKYWALRLGLFIFVIAIMYFFGIHQHQELR